MAAYTLEQLVEIVADDVKAKKALEKHPNSLEAAIDYVFTAPESDFQEEPMPALMLPPQDLSSVNGAPPFGANTPSTTELPPYTSADLWKSIPASQAQHASGTEWAHNENVNPTTSPYFQAPAGMNVPIQPSSSASNQAFGPHRPTSPPPSRPVVHTIEDDDDEIARAIEASLIDQGGQTATAGWSAQSGSWQHNDVDVSSTNKSSSNKSVVLKEPTAKDQEDPELAWALNDSLTTTSTRAPSPVPQKAFEDDLSPMDQLRAQEAGSPVVLRVTSPFLGALPALLQALYASKPFRNALLAMVLPQPAFEFDFTYQAYWRGESTWAVPEQATQLDQTVCILAALQRLFVFMTYTKRRIINVQDIVVALQIKPDHSMMREPVLFSRNQFDRILLAWKHVSEHLRTSNPTEADEEIYQARLRVCVPSGIEWSYDSEVPAYTSDVQTLPVLVSPPECNDLHSSLAASIGHSAEKKTLQLLDRKPAMLVLCPYREAWGEKDLENFGSGIGRKIFRFEEKIWVDRYEVGRKDEILIVRQKEEELLEKKRGLEEKKALLSIHQGKDMFETMRSTIAYYEKIARPQDEEHGKKQEAMKLKLQKILSLMQVEVDSINEELSRINNELSGLFESDEWKRSAPYELSAVTMYDGIPGKQHVFAYIKADDGQWYKATNDNKTEVSSLEALQSDASGLHMRSGAYTLIYTCQQEDQPGSSGPVAETLLDAINLDNHSFKVLYPDELTENWNLPALPEHAGDTTITPMQMDEQVRFTDVSDDEPLAVDIHLEEPNTLEAQMAAILPQASATIASSNLVGPSDPASITNASNPPRDIMDAPNAMPESVMSPNVPATAPEASTSAYRSPSIQPSSPDKPTSPLQQSVSGHSPYLNSSKAQSPVLVADDSTDDEIEFTGEKPGNPSMRLRGGHDPEVASDDDSDAHSDASSGNVYLGTLEPLEEYNVWTLQGLVGGRPFWVNPVWPLSKEELICGHCMREDAMRLLLELSAAPDDDEDAFIRYLYVFTCTSAKCLEKAPTKSIRVFRMQLPKGNNYHPLDPHKASNKDLAEHETALKSARDFFDDAEKHLCPVCRLMGTVLCSGCRRQNYCGKAHQKLAWKSHKAQCKSSRPEDGSDFFDQPELPESVLRAAVWPAYHVASQDEPSSVPAKRKRTSSNASGRENVRDGKKHGKAGTTDVDRKQARESGKEVKEDDPEDELAEKNSSLVISEAEPLDSADTQEPETQTAVDGSFLDFVDRVNRRPNQVLRYYRINPAGEGDDQPIWPSSKGQNPPLKDVPACENCSAPRTAELQIMPAVLTSLDIDDTQPDSFDFGTIVIYTCSRNCLWPVPPDAEWRFAATAGTWQPNYGWAREAAVCQMNDDEELNLGQAVRRS